MSDKQDEPQQLLAGSVLGLGLRGKTMGRGAVTTTVHPQSTLMVK